MLLILDHGKTRFNTMLFKVAGSMGLAPLFFTPVELVHDVKLSYRLSDDSRAGSFAYNGTRLRFSDISAVFCWLDTFHPGLWRHFSVQDSEYAALEYHALWWSILHGLDCPVVNPPAGDTLAGMKPSLIQLAAEAQRAGLKPPEIYYAPPGASVRNRAEKEDFAVTDLGAPGDVERPSRETGIAGNIENDIRLYRVPQGVPVWIAMAGNRIFAAATTGKDGFARFPREKIPDEIISGVTTLHKTLGLVLAEYQFTVTRAQEWVISAMTRRPCRVFQVDEELVMQRIVTETIQDAA